MPDVTAIMMQIAPVSAQVMPVVPHISTKLSGFPIVSPLNSLMELAPVLANLSPVLVPVNSVSTKVSPIGTEVAIFAQRKR